MTNGEPILLGDGQRSIIKALAKGLLKRCSTNPAFDWEDCFQVGCLAVWKLARERGAPLEDAEANVVAANAMRSTLRASRADDRRRLAVASEPSRPRVAPDPSRADLVDGRDAFDALSEAERDVVHRRCWLGMKNVEISDATGLSVNVVCNRFQSAFGKIRARLGDAYADEYSRKHPRRYSVRRINGPRWVPSVDVRRAKREEKAP